MFVASLTYGESDRVSFTADNVETVLTKGSERTTLTGNVVLNTGDSEIFADRIELYGEKVNFVLAQGNVRLIQEEGRIELNSKNLFYDRKRGLIRTRGATLIIDRDHDIVINGNYIERWDQRKETIIRSGVHIVGTELEAHSEFAHYFRDDQTIKLSGLPMVTWKGNEYRATNICLDLKTERIVLTGTVSGEVVVQ